MHINLIEIKICGSIILQITISLLASLTIFNYNINGVFVYEHQNILSCIHKFVDNNTFFEYRNMHLLRLTYLKFHPKLKTIKRLYNIRCNTVEICSKLNLIFDKVSI